MVAPGVVVCNTKRWIGTLVELLRDYTCGMGRVATGSILMYIESHVARETPPLAAAHSDLLLQPLL